jgi:hypothetical protein
MIPVVPVRVKLGPYRRGSARVLAKELVEITDLEKKHAICTHSDTYIPQSTGQPSKGDNQRCLNAPGYSFLRAKYCCTMGVIFSALAVVSAARAARASLMSADDCRAHVHRATRAAVATRSIVTCLPPIRVSRPNFINNTY